MRTEAQRGCTNRGSSTRGCRVKTSGAPTRAPSSALLADGFSHRCFIRTPRLGLKKRSEESKQRTGAMSVGEAYAVGFEGSSRALFGIFSVFVMKMLAIVHDCTVEILEMISGALCPREFRYA